MPDSRMDNPPENNATEHRYAELHCISNFTFLRGASHPEELVTRAAELGYHALAMTDECSLAGIVRAHVAAKEHNMHLIIGSEFTLDDGLQLVALAENRNGYGHLCELISLGRQQASKGQYQLSREDVLTHLKDCVVLWCPNVDQSMHEEQGQWLVKHFPQRVWLAIELLNQGDDHQRLSELLALAEHLAIPALAAGNIHMHVRNRRYLQDTLTAIRLGKPLHQLGYELYASGERHLRSLPVLAKRYPAELLQETRVVAKRCQFSLDELRYEYPQELVPAGITATDWLRQLVEQGMHWRWPDGVPNNVRSLIDKELALIAELGYAYYFLTVHDIITFARNQGILCQGRGSAANSAVCYCLGITEVDPTQMSMLFERFISKERNEPPDIDVDFEHQRREEVLQYIYQKYGRDRAALAATVISYRTKSALRDVGKALGLEQHALDRLASVSGWNRYTEVPPERLVEAGFDPESPLMRRFRYLVAEIRGFPRHLSQHVGGMVISQGPLCRLVPIENAAMAERTVIQWDKDDLDALGLLKVDCLALGMLSAIRRAFELVAQTTGRLYTMATVPAEDAATYQMIQRADTIGVFQIESRAQMTMLPRLKPKTFYDLVIEVAIVRPGPIQGGMVHPYLKRRRGEEPVSYPSDAVRQVLERTLGVPIFQEQVMQLAIVAAGFTPGEADQLRRAMASWHKRGGLEPFRDKLVQGMLARGYSGQLGEQLYRQIQGFADYGFPESHAASFALLVYVSAWLKCHHPAAFCAALLNSQPMGFYAPAQLVQDAKRHGVEVLPVSINCSDWDCTLENKDDGTTGQPVLRLGLRLVEGLARKTAIRIVDVRGTGVFLDVEDLQQRTKLSQRDTKLLAQADALKELSGNRRQALWQVLGLENAQSALGYGRPQEVMPSLASPTEGEEVIADYAQLGLSLRAHPLALLRGQLQQRRYLTLIQLKKSALKARMSRQPDWSCIASVQALLRGWYS